MAAALMALAVTGAAGAATAPMAKLSNVSVSSLSDATWTLVTWGTEDFDSSGFHDGTNPARLTAPATGIYLVTANGAFAGNGTGIRGIQVTKNTQTANSGVVGTAAGGPVAGISNLFTFNEMVSLTAGDYLAMHAYQSSGGSLNLLTDSDFGILKVDEDLGGGGGASELDDLTDVTVVSPIDGAVLKYDEAESQWKVATDDVGSGGSSGPVTLSAGDRERLDLNWWGVWAIVGLLLVLMIAPQLMSVMRVTRGMVDGRG